MTKNNLTRLTRRNFSASGIKIILNEFLILGILGIFLNVPAAVFSQQKSTAGDLQNLVKIRASKSAVEDSFVWRKLANPAFGVGEKLVFIIRWGPVHAGEAVMEIPEIVTVNGRRAYRIVSRAATNRTFSLFFRVRDRVESLMDVEGLFSWHFEKHLREGKFSADIEEVFNQQHHFVISRGDTIPVTPYVQDVLSALYFVRTQPLTVGKPILVDNYADRKVYPLEVKVLRKESIKVQAGTFDCVVIRPILRSAGIFQQKGELTVWLTDDKTHTPVLMKSKVIVGSFVAELKKYTLGDVK